MTQYNFDYPVLSRVCRPNRKKIYHILSTNTIEVDILEGVEPLFKIRKSHHNAADFVMDSDGKIYGRVINDNTLSKFYIYSLIYPFLKTFSQEDVIEGRKYKRHYNFSELFDKALGDSKTFDKTKDYNILSDNNEEMTQHIMSYLSDMRLFDGNVYYSMALFPNNLYFHNGCPLFAHASLSKAVSGIDDNAKIKMMTPDVKRDALCSILYAFHEHTQDKRLESPVSSFIDSPEYNVINTVLTYAHNGLSLTDMDVSDVECLLNTLLPYQKTEIQDNIFDICEILKKRISLEHQSLYTL